MGLIETWDVLKSPPQWQNPARWLFNRNMGCIEISPLLHGGNKIMEFNRNMGCIEILVNEIMASAGGGFNRNMGCIEIIVNYSHISSR